MNYFEEYPCSICLSKWESSIDSVKALGGRWKSTEPNCCSINATEKEIVYVICRDIYEPKLPWIWLLIDWGRMKFGTSALSPTYPLLMESLTLVIDSAMLDCDVCKYMLFLFGFSPLLRNLYTLYIISQN